MNCKRPSGEVSICSRRSCAQTVMKERGRETDGKKEQCEPVELEAVI
jgi:hypothetical protein